MIKWLHENRQIITKSAGSLLAVILLVVLLKEESGEEITSALKRVSIWYFLAGVIVMLISRLFVVNRWHVLLRSAGVEVSFWRTAMLTFTGLFSSNFLPTTIGGDAVRLAGGMQLGYDRAICLASLVADRLIGMAGMVITLPLGLISIFPFGSGGLQSISFAGLFQKGVEFVKRTYDVFVIWFKRPLALFVSFLSTFGNMLFIFLAIFLLIIGMGRHVSYWLIAGLWGLTYFVTLIPISLNRDYLERYCSDLQNHRFSLVIAENQKFAQQKKGAFVEENNAWVRYVGVPLLCAYEPVESLNSTNLKIFEPRSGHPSCKDPFSN